MQAAMNPDLLMSIGMVAIVIGAISIGLWQVVAIKKLSMLTLNKRAASKRSK
jgi:hypothetical protein